MFRQYREIRRGDRIVAGYDMAMGGKDYTAIQFISTKYKDAPLVYHAQEIATISTNRILPILARLYHETGNKVVILPEINSGGIFEVERMLGSPESIYFDVYSDNGKVGFQTNISSKREILALLKNAIDNKLLTIYDKLTIDELYSFVLKEMATGWTVRAESGKHDDLVMSLALAYYVSLKKPQESYIAPQKVEDLPVEELFNKDGFY
jgi:hypothetical protein